MKLYGLGEIAEELGVEKNRVSIWRHRGKLPVPDAVLAMGPVWKESTIRAFLARVRKEGRP